MDSRNNERAKMIVWLRDAIEHETSKSDDEIDYELVDEFSKLLSELMGDQTSLTEEEAKQRLAQIVERKPKEVKRKPRVKLKRIVTIACAAMVILCAAVTIGSFDRSENTTMRAMFNQCDGGTFNESGITYIRMNHPTTYSSLDELVKKEDLDINLPSILPKGVKIEKVLYNDANSIIIEFNDDALQLEICSISYISIEEITKNSSKITINSVDTYITEKNYTFSSYTVIDDKVYMITSDTEEKIETIINGMIGDKNENN